jgi:hypothetical protein
MDVRNPFPGMNPWLESHFNDLHPRLLSCAADQLKPQLPGHLALQILERHFMELPAELALDRVEYPNCTTDAERAKYSPIIVHLKKEDIIECFLQIYDVISGGRVTVLEILTSAAKAGRLGSRHYREWQKELVEAGTSLVEIDLLRGGDWVLYAPLMKVPAQHRTPYRVSIHRGSGASPVDLYPIPLDAQLPVIRIPLLENQEELNLDLQEMLLSALESGNAEADYTQQLDPPLNPDDAAWAEATLRENGLRPGTT